MDRTEMSLGAEKLPKRARLTTRSEFLTLSRGGKKIHTPHFLILSKANDKGENRLGVTVSAKVGQAVVRNRIKRRLREFFRRHRQEWSGCRDYVIVAKQGAGEISSSQALKELRDAFQDRRVPAP
ncbi:MAG: ribonuclease P protein component [Candidatus Binatia bacterium]